MSKKFMLTVTAGAFLGAATFAPAPASAFAPLFFVPFMANHVSPNVGAAQPADAKMAKKARSAKKKRK